MRINSERRFPWFWLFYLLYILLIAGILFFGLSLLWNFLDVFEQTRPVHFMEKSISVFEESGRDELQAHLTNTVENPYEDVSTILDLFYDSVEGKEISFGKLSGYYSELHPVYAILADDEHVATVSLASDNKIVGYNFSGWVLKEITLLLTPTKSFAITVPSSMTVQINGIPVAEEHVVSTVETDTPVSYVNYAFSGLYKEPDIQVTDRYGSPVTLKKDEETGGLYYKLAYASAPATMELSFGGHVLDEGNTLVSGIEVEELSIVSQIANTFSEYKSLPEQLTIPTFTEYYIDFAYTEDTVVFTDRFGKTRIPAHDTVINKYSYCLVSDDSLQEECMAFASDFLQTYALFSSGDADNTALKKFFPANSEFCARLGSMDNRWFTSHSNIRFDNHKIEEFFAYSENLVYIRMSIDETMWLTWLYTDKLVKLNHPLWLVKLDGNWYVANMIFESFKFE